MATSPSSEKGRRTSKPLLVAALLLCAAALAYVFAHPPRTVLGSVDFNAYYCAGTAVRNHKDPYRYEPLHTCEVTNARPATPNVVVPAPFPPYVLLATAPFTNVPFVQSSLAWELLLLAAALVIVWVIVELTALPLLLVATCVIVGVWMPSLRVGAVAPLPIALMCVAAFAVTRRQWNMAALALAGTCVEPHVALPVLIAVFVALPEMRLRVAAVLVAIAGLSLFAGPASNAEYFARVLPAHAASELHTAGQYGLSAVLSGGFGVNDGTAIKIASLQYAAFAVAGVLLAYRLRGRMPEAIVFAPLACAVTGGTFVHLTQISAVLPLALGLAARDRSLIAWLGLTLVAVPWQAAFDNREPYVAGFTLLVVLLYRFKWPIAAAWSFAVTGCIALAQRYEKPPGDFRPIPNVLPNAMAEDAWTQLTTQFPPTVMSWVAHGLTYSGLAIVLWITASLSLEQDVRQPAPPVRRIAVR